MTGNEVKALILSKNLKCWEVAEAWGMTDGNFSRKLRKPFNEEDTAKLYQIIETLTHKKQEV
ncbi:MAG: hypothetical protein E7508_05915 [Ruminococcus sp.]|nr:hypothetical protein [Ruminococcus sp.]